MMIVFVDYINATCMQKMWVIKNREQCMRNGISSYLPTGRAGDNNGEGDIDTQHTDKESRGSKQRDRKRKKNENLKSNEVELSFHL